MNIHKIGTCLNIELEDGTSLTNNNCTDEFFAKVVAVRDNREAILDLFYPENQSARIFMEKLKTSKILTQEGSSIYIKNICELTVPQDFASKILDAEINKDQNKLDAYLNFWTLLSLNPDSRVRNNLFWFLNRWGMVISKSGLIVAYRNADIKTEGTQFNQGLTKFVTQEYTDRKYLKKGPLHNMWVIMDDNTFEIVKGIDLDADSIVIGELENLYETLSKDSSNLTTVYTDHHSHSFSIRLGHIVSMPREDCDKDQHQTCSTGLHCAAKNWLQNNYFGQVGMRVLVNPADVVAVPPEDNYGKMRTCAYYPVNIVNYDKDGHIIDNDIESGFEDDFLSKICYTGEVNNEDNDNYKLNVPEAAEVHRETIYNKLKSIASTITRKI